ncbi:hypothetical protein [Sagittula stellata]|uniref:Uncharacterized protein n=1 Tax=Sagittula stellata (strain ATCC 700073 / DSM 11524 / E-37) TaxID=388399 RepID=A3K0P0_SAGS3|nr:hypothetical protein [Sagittula stellata]EBA09355.1 hypothetical protein SSE37_23974 [Sagittula stellata E-37]
MTWPVLQRWGCFSAVRVLPLCLAVGFGPLPACAEELGVMTARVDGAPMEWRLYAFDRSGGQIATAAFRQDQWLAELQLQGHVEPDFSSADVMSLTVRFPGWYAPGVAPMSVDILYVPERLGGPFWTSRGARQGPSVEIVRFDVMGRMGEIDLAFAGKLCRKAYLSAPVDLGNCVEVLGRVVSRVVME